MMMALGCVQSRHCNNNLCPTGIATQDPARAKAVDIQDKSERVKNFHKNTLKNFYELVGSMGLDDPDKLMPHMIKRRTSNGLLSPVGSLVKPLKTNALIDGGDIAEPWQHWWKECTADSFYVEDHDTNSMITTLSID